MEFIDIAFTEELQALQKDVRAFCDREVRPIARQLDEGMAVPEELWRKMGARGYFGLMAGPEYGGSNAGHLALAVATEEASRASGVMYTVITGQNGAYYDPILFYGTQRQKERYIPGCVRGTLKGAFCLTEPGAGSDAGGMLTTARLEGDHYIINGEKIFITNGENADFFVVFCRSQEGPVCLIVDRDTPGVSVSPSEKKMGLHGIGLNSIAFMDVEVPRENLVGQTVDGFEAAKASLIKTRMGVAAGALGMAQEAISQAVAYAKSHTLDGTSLARHQGVQFLLAECQAKLDAARLLVYRCAHALDCGRAETYMASEAKYIGTEFANDIAGKCLEIMGEAGCTDAYAVERIFRDLKVFEIFDGTTEIHKILISKWMGVR